MVNKNAISVNDHKEVVSIVKKYIEAFRLGNFSMLADIFYEDSVTYGIVDGELVGGSDNPSAKFIELNGASPETEAHIDVLDMSPTTAVVRILTEKDAIGSDCREYLTLIKSKKGWVVISECLFGKWAGCDSSSGCGQQSNEPGWPGSPARPSATHLI